jgi:hypothetical protein
MHEIFETHLRIPRWMWGGPLGDDGHIAALEAKAKAEAERIASKWVSSAGGDPMVVGSVVAKMWYCLSLPISELGVRKINRPATKVAGIIGMDACVVGRAAVLSDSVSISKEGEVDYCLRVKEA